MSLCHSSDPYSKQSIKPSIVTMRESPEVEQYLNQSRLVRLRWYFTAIQIANEEYSEKNKKTNVTNKNQEFCLPTKLGNPEIRVVTLA